MFDVGLYLLPTRGVEIVDTAFERLINPKAQHRHDMATSDDLNWSRFDIGLPDGLEIQWLGTAGFRISYGDTTILIDPYLICFNLCMVLMLKRLEVSKGAVAQHIDAADAILVGHMYFDHALDIPEIVAQFGSIVYGSASLRRLLGLYGFATNVVEVENHRIYSIGPFDVTFVPSLYSKLVFGLKVFVGGEFTCDNLDSLGQGKYCCG